MRDGQKDIQADRASERETETDRQTDRQEKLRIKFKRQVSERVGTNTGIKIDRQSWQGNHFINTVANSYSFRQMINCVCSSAKAHKRHDL